MKIEVGTKLWYVESRGGNRGVEASPREATVSKVGRKYFELEGIRNGRSSRKFDIETLKDQTDTNYPYKLYETPQEIFALREREKLVQEVRKYFSGFTYQSKLTTDQLRRISDIINE